MRSQCTRVYVPPTAHQSAWSVIVGKVHACVHEHCLASASERIWHRSTREVTRQDLRSQKAKDKHRQSYRKVHIVSMSWLVESAGLAGSRLQCASAAIAGESVLIVPAAFLSSLASG